MRSAFLTGFFRSMPMGYVLRTMGRPGYLTTSLRFWVSAERSSVLAVRNKEVVGWDDDLLALTDPPIAVRGAARGGNSTFARQVLEPISVNQPCTARVVLDHPAAFVRLHRLERAQDPAALLVSLNSNSGKILGDSSKGGRMRWVVLNSQLRPAAPGVEFLIAGIPEEQGKAIETWCETHDLELDEVIPYQLAVVQVVRQLAAQNKAGPLFLIITSSQGSPTLACIDPQKGILYFGEPPEANSYAISEVIAEVTAAHSLPSTRVPVLLFDRGGVNSLFSSAEVMDANFFGVRLGPVIPPALEASLPSLPGPEGWILQHLGQ